MMGKIGEGQTRPSSLAVSPSVYLFATVISAHFSATFKREYLETRVGGSEG